MDDLLTTLQPEPLWRYFLELSRIPRASRSEAAAAAWVADQGRGRIMVICAYAEYVHQYCFVNPSGS